MWACVSVMVIEHVHAANTACAWPHAISACESARASLAERERERERRVEWDNLNPYRPPAWGNLLAVVVGTGVQVVLYEAPMDPL